MKRTTLIFLLFFAYLSISWNPFKKSFLIDKLKSGNTYSIKHIPNNCFGFIITIDITRTEDNYFASYQSITNKKLNKDQLDAIRVFESKIRKRSNHRKDKYLSQYEFEIELNKKSINNSLDEFESWTILLEKLDLKEKN